jgi:hypothetical protein
MANYSIVNSSGTATIKVLTGTYSTLVLLQASTGATGPTIELRRGKVYDMLVGTNVTPVDAFVQYDVSRVTAGSTAVYAGIMSSIGQQQLDTADGNMATFAVINSTAEGGITVTPNSNIWNVGVNARASYRWVAAPGSELVWAASASAGVCLRAATGGGSITGTATVMFQEQ